MLLRITLRWKGDSEVEQAIREAAEFGDGFWKIFQRLRRDGKPWKGEDYIVPILFTSRCMNLRVLYDLLVMLIIFAG